MNTEFECERTLLIQADFDGELDAGQAALLVQHRAECAHCQGVEEQLNRSRVLMRAASRYRASEELRRVIRGQGESAGDAGRTSLPASARGAARRTSGASSGQRSTAGAGVDANTRARIWFGHGAGLGWAAAAAAVVLAVVLLGWPRGTDLGSQLVSSHVRAMQMESHLIDVVSTDHHTVKPWFAGRIDFAPPVKQLDSQGYVLKGGRVDVVNGATAAVMVYQAGKHIVDVYVWPTRAGAGHLSTGPIDGFNLRHWQEGDFEVACVSDLASAELDRFAERWREST
jgi:anti-sigma factor RsiW